MLSDKINLTPRQIKDRQRYLAHREERLRKSHEYWEKVGRQNYRQRLYQLWGERNIQTKL